MLDAGNPYVLPSVLVGAAVYLGLTVATDASLPIRIGVLLVFVAVVPIVLNRTIGRRRRSTTDDGEGESPATDEGSPAADNGSPAADDSVR